MATDTVSDNNTSCAGVEEIIPKVGIGNYKASVQDVLAFLKSGRKAPAHFANLDKISTKKCLHTLSEFSRNFKYEDLSDTLYYVGKRGKENQSPAKVLFTKKEFARCLVQDLSMTEKVNMNCERKRIPSTICGSCYDDVNSGRNTGICKICRKDDNDDWLGCDRCGQFFHASCVGVDFAKAVLEYFYC